MAEENPLERLVVELAGTLRFIQAKQKEEPKGDIPREAYLRLEVLRQLLDQYRKVTASMLREAGQDPNTSLSAEVLASLPPASRRFIEQLGKIATVAEAYQKQYQALVDSAGKRSSSPPPAELKESPRRSRRRARRIGGDRLV